LSATSQAAEATPPQPSVPTLAVCALRLRQPMESDRITQPFSSRDFTILMVGKLRKPSWPLPVGFHPAPCFSHLPRPISLGHPHGPLEGTSAELWGQHRANTVDWCLGPGGAPSSPISLQFHSPVSPGSRQADSRWRGALHRRTGSWLGGCQWSGVWSQPEALKEDLGLSLRKRPKETLACAALAGASGAELQPVRHSQSCAF